MRPDIADKIMAEVQESYDAIASDFSATRLRPWPEMKLLRQYLRPGAVVLDVGCGNGRLYQSLADVTTSYVGVDVSAGLLAEARRLQAGTPAVFKAGSLLALPAPDASADLVAALASLNHIPSAPYRLKAMREMARVLKPGGTLFMTNWNLFKLDRRWRWVARAVWERLRGRFPFDWNDLLIPWKRGAVRQRYYHVFTSGEMARLCRRAGLEIVTQFYSHGGEPTPWWRGDNLVTVARRSA